MQGRCKHRPHRCTARFARVSIGGRRSSSEQLPVLHIGRRVALPGAFVQAVAEAEMPWQARCSTGSANPSARPTCSAASARSPWLARRSRSPLSTATAGRLRPCRALLVASGLKPIEARLRDLFREPLSPRELAQFDAVVLDPPRAGAKAQCGALAGSDVSSIVYVSCDPATLARDARILVDAGYRLGEVVLVDQFLFAAHVELVAAFKR
jgi:23S rRNA (uracil1939-C5)-methyltransferase